MDWVALLTAIGVIGSIILGIVTLMRTLQKDKQDNRNIARNLAAENLDEIFDGNQKLLKNYSDQIDKLTLRVIDLEKENSIIKLEKQTEIDTLTAERNELGHKLLASQGENAKLIKQLAGV